MPLSPAGLLAVLVLTAPLEGGDYSCGPLVQDSSRFLLAMLDRWTGLPYDQVACGGPPSSQGPGLINRAWGVVPQLADAAINTFSQDPALRDETVLWSFADRGPDGAEPSLLYALRLELRLSPPDGTNAFGGLLWDANANVRRYRTLRIRYSTSPGADWELKLNTGLPGQPESVVHLLPSAAGAWRDAEFDLVSGFPPPVTLERLNYLVFVAHSAQSGQNPILWVDQVSLAADPQQVASCAPPCPEPLPSHPDLACRERGVMTGAVNVANALSALSLLPSVGLLDAGAAQEAVARILTTLESFPVHAATQRWFQDWHSAASGMPHPDNRVASLTDQPQLYAALMVVEQTWPSLAPRAAALRAKMGYASLLDSPGACQIHWAFNRCTGVMPGYLEFVGRDSLLGSFLSVASGEVAPCVWDSLAPVGCALDGPPESPWYTTGEPCRASPIPAIGTGGPFLQLAGLTYLSSDEIPLGSLSLAQSARHMLQAQAAFAPQRLPLAGWANASDPERCDYLTCKGFTPAKVTPYIWAMGHGIGAPEAAEALLAFERAGTAAPLDTGTRSHAFGLRDAWNQETMSGRNAYLYLDTGWSLLGLLNGCHQGLVRQRFDSHPVAQNGYALLQARPPLCGAAAR